MERCSSSTRACRAALQHPVFRDGDWRLLECEAAWEHNWTADCFVAWFWKDAAGDRRLVAVNYAANQSQCYVRLPIDDLDGSSVRFASLIGGVGFDRERSDLDARGLYLDMPPWGYYVLGVAARLPAGSSGDRARAVQSVK